MKKILLAILLIAIGNIAFAVPQYINYQGILRDSAGTTQSGTFNMTFKIYNASSGGSEVFDSGTQSVSVSNGIYNVRIGPVDSSTILDGNDKWLEITVGSDTLSPRLRINSVAYAVRADVATNSTTVNNINASTEATASYLYPLDSSGKLSGVPVSAEASSGYALFISGRLGASSSAVGTGQINGGDTSATVTNSSLTSNSIIILTVGHAASTANTNSNGGIRVSAVNLGSNQFTVSTMDNAGASANIPFSYLIIN